MEEWRDIPDCNGYRASSLGRIRSRLGRIVGSTRTDPNNKYNRYVSVTVFINGERNVYGAHCLVALAFHGSPPPGKPYCDHMNGDTTDNRLCNLQWTSASGNQLNKFGFGISGVKGLYFKERPLPRHNLWECRIQVLDKRYIKCFPESQKQDAIDWLRNKRDELGIFDRTNL